MRTPKPESPSAAPSAPRVLSADTQCRASHCPARATIFDSVTGPPRNGICRYHDAAKPQQWPLVTAILNTTQNAQETYDRLLTLGLHFPFLLKLPQERTYSLDEVADAKAFVKEFARSGRPLLPQPDKEWARVLQLREEAGEPLSILQRSMWREALRSESGDVELLAERAAIRFESAPL